MTEARELLERLAELRHRDAKSKVFGASSHRYELAPPLSEEAVEELERQHGVRLPEDYRAFLLKMGNGGAGPAYGVFPFGKWDGAGQGLEHWTGKAYVVSDLARNFPLTEPWQLPEERFEQPESFDRPEDEDEWWERLDAEHYPESLTRGWFPICHHGCALRTFLVVSGPERGHVWFDGRPEHSPVTPHEHDGKRLTFFEWYRVWLDKSLREVGA